MMLTAFLHYSVITVNNCLKKIQAKLLLVLFFLKFGRLKTSAHYINTIMTIKMIMVCFGKVEPVQFQNAPRCTECKGQGET